MKLLHSFTFIVPLLAATMYGQVSPAPHNKNRGNLISKNECMAKGGLGIINTHLYIALNSDKNELILDGGNRWSDKPRMKIQVVFYFQARIWPSDDLPLDFKLSKAILVSFEGNNVSFFDFGAMSGGFYRRPL